MTLFVALFIAGLLTILLPCILPLIPIVLGVSIAGRSKLRPLCTVIGMLISFVGFTFLLVVLLGQFVELADYIRLATYLILLLFGVGFLTENRMLRDCFALAGGFMFLEKDLVAVFLASAIALGAMEFGGSVANFIQQLGTSWQSKARVEFGDSNVTAFIIGLTLGLIWVPCAGPALSFAFTLVREEPGLRALLALLSYGLGTAVPLLLIGYGGQSAVHSVRALAPYTGTVKRVSGALLIVTAIALRLHAFENLQVWFLDHTSIGDVGTRIEEKYFNDLFAPTPAASSLETSSSQSSSQSSAPTKAMQLPKLPKIIRAPEFTGLGPWHKSQPLTMAGLQGKVVLIDFWTYSCINCIRTLPYIQGYWEKFKDTGKFVIVGVHTPEFIFEKSQSNVADALKRHGLTYPVAQDNDFGTWSAFANQYWPAKYLIDANGYIRYTHFGEGAYDETDLAIQSLLAEAGVDVAKLGEMPPEERAMRRNQTPEIYLGIRSWPALGNAQGDPMNEVVGYASPSALVLNKYYLDGQWQLVDDEHQALRSKEGQIRMRFLGKEINLVLGLIDGAKPVVADVSIDGKHVKTITIDRHDLFNLYSGDYGEHEMTLNIRGPGVEAFAFTFGS